MKVMRTYMRGDLVCCQSHEEVYSDSEFKPDVFSSPRGGVTGFIMKRKPRLDPAVPTFFNFEGSLTRAPLASHS